MSSATEFASSPAPFPFQLKRIVFATDFSECSENAGRYAGMMARRFGAELLVAHTFVLSQAAMEVEAEQGAPKSVQRTDLQAALQQEAQRLSTGGLLAQPVLVEGEPQEQIPALAREKEPALIVLGTQGRGRLDRALMGSVSEKILRSTNGPTLTIGPLVPPCCKEDPPIRRVLFATGLSEAAARGAGYAASITEAFGAEMEVLHVIHPEDVEEPGTLDQVQERFAAELERIVPRHAGQITQPRGVLATGTTHTRVLEHIRENAIDLLVLSLRRSSHLWLQSRLSGAFAIVTSAPCPVLTILG